MTGANRGWVLTQRPVGEDFDAALHLRDLPMPEPGPGEILVRTQYLSLDPANRGWMAGPTYIPAVPLGGPMWGGVLGRVERSNDPNFVQGDVVSGMGTWTEDCSLPGDGVGKLPDLPGIPLTAFQSALGVGGWTAYFGLTDIGKPKAGETLVVSAAAGAVGSAVGQIGKILGCRVIGIAGSAAKCAWLTGELGFDHAIDYRKENVRKRLAELCPDGVNIYFENVGGDVGNAVIANLAINGRVILCGLISQYNTVGKVDGIDISPVLMKRGTIQGFVVTDVMHRLGEASAALGGWFAQGKLKYKVDIVDGLENAITAFRRLFVQGGDHMGKMMVRVDPQAPE